MDFAQFEFKVDEYHDDRAVINSPIKKVKYETVSVAKTKVSKSVTKSNVYQAPEPVVPIGLSELYHSLGSPEYPLKLLVVGHNPSDQSYTKGHFYANPSNRMWHLLVKAGIVPKHFTCNDDGRCPVRCGLGFTDLICGVSETKSNRFSGSEVREHKSSLFARLEQHLHRAAAECNIPVEEAYPKVVAFSGVRQWRMLFPSNSPEFQTASSSSSSQAQHTLSKFFAAESVDLKAETTESVLSGASVNEGPLRRSKGQFGVQTARPPGWPACLAKTIVFVLSSSSGAAAMTNEEREGPYLELGQLLQQFPWPVTYAQMNTNKASENSGGEDVDSAATKKEERNDLGADSAVVNLVSDAVVDLTEE